MFFVVLWFNAVVLLLLGVLGEFLPEVVATVLGIFGEFNGGVFVFDLDEGDEGDVWECEWDRLLVLGDEIFVLPMLSNSVFSILLFPLLSVVDGFFFQ